MHTVWKYNIKFRLLLPTVLITNNHILHTSNDIDFFLIDNQYVKKL